LDRDKVVLGRNPDCHIVIGGHAVSREHAHILRVQGKFFIEDRDSRNGTFVNNQQIAARTPLKDNDRIKICDFLCTYHDSVPAKPLPAELRREEAEPDEPEGTSTFEATIGRISSQQLYESQPAEKLKVLLEISNSLSRTLELDPLLPKIADNLFQLFRQADRCFLILREENSDKLLPKMIKTRRPNAETTARFSKSIVKQCMETTQALLSEDASSDSRFGLSQSISDFRIRSVMCVPLCTADGKAFGVIQLDTQDRSKKFTQDDLTFMVGVANQASTALENAKLHEEMVARERFSRDLELAREVQRGFLPRRLPELPGYQFYAQYDAALQVGGDYYDFIPLASCRLGVMLGDVAGKGVPAALLMAKLSAEGRFCMLTEPQAAVAVSKLNDMLLQAGLMDRFVTLAAAVLDPSSHAVTLINAGHVAPMIYRPGKGLEDGISNADSGLPLGVVEGIQYSAVKVDLKPGECVLLFTDGVTDAMNVQNQQFQMKGIHAAVQGGPFTPAQLGERIVKAVKQHSQGRSQHDDITLVCFGRTLGNIDAEVTAPIKALPPRT
jgi:serine phosphatase RsbU (regulator of sigma subunit)